MTPYDDVDRLILERWDEVTRLVEAREQLKVRIATVVEAAGRLLTPWMEQHGYTLAVHAKEAEFRAWRRSWTERRKDPAVEFVLDGFCPAGYRKGQGRYPSLWLYIAGLEQYKIKEEGRRRFGEDVRVGLGDFAAEWVDDECVPDRSPLVRFLADAPPRNTLVASSENLFSFATEQFPRFFAIADAVDAVVRRTVPSLVGV